MPKKNKNIVEQVATIQQENIADKRLEYWNVKYLTGGREAAILGETVSEKAYAELKMFADKEMLDFQVILLPSEEYKQDPWAVVALSVCNIRRDGRHSAELLTQALMGTPVKVYKKNNGWYLIQTPDRYFGWVDESAITLKTNEELSEWKAFPKVLYNKVSGFGYAKARLDTEIETDLVLANLLSVMEEDGEFYRTILADGRMVFVSKNECISLDEWQNKNIDATKVLATASTFKGVPYLWGGTSAKMVDCSGYTKTVFYRHGIIIQRDASQQTLYGELVDTEKDYSNLEPGDLVFFGKKATKNSEERVTHVGLSLGKQEFIHASGKVRINSLDRQSERYTKKYETDFVRARSVIGNVGDTGIEWVVDNEFYNQILPE